MKINYTSTRNISIITQGDLIRDFLYYAHFYDEPNAIVFRGIFRSFIKKIGKDYESYLKRNLNSRLLKKLDSFKLNDPINSLDDVLTPNDQIILREFMVNNYEEDIEADDLWGEYMYEDIDVKLIFEEYLELRKINNGIFISHIYLQISYIIESIEESLNEIIDDINVIYNFKDVINSSLIAEYTNFYKNQITEDYFQNIKNSIQVYGFFDEKGIYIDKKLTLRNAVQYYQNINNELQINKDNYLELNTPVVLSYLRYRYFYYKFFNSEPDTLFDKSKQYLKEEFETFKRKYSKLTTFLSNKSFSVQEIDIILNLLSNNRYSELEIRSLNLNKQITLFRCLWLFGIFEYFKYTENNKFENMKDFEVLLMINKNNHYDLKSYSAQFKKYFDYTKGTNHVDNPFNQNSTQTLILAIENDLIINREKLIALPN